MSFYAFYFLKSSLLFSILLLFTLLHLGFSVLVNRILV